MGHDEERVGDQREWGGQVHFMLDVHHGVQIIFLIN